MVYLRVPPFRAANGPLFRMKSLSHLPQRLAWVPTPLAGLALGLASLGWCIENLGGFAGRAQLAGAVLGLGLLCILCGKFLLHPRLLREDLAHPVIGSLLPTSAMTTMLVAKALSEFFPEFSQGLWLFAVTAHAGMLCSFILHRARGFRLNHLLPSWFVPPVGIIVAALTCPAAEQLWLARLLLGFGLFSLAVLLPLTLYRLLFGSDIPDAAKPTLAILAAPASLALAGYLSVSETPSLFVVALLFGVAVLLTLVVWLAFLRLLRLPFSPGFSAFTFPMVIGATAQFKVAQYLSAQGIWGDEAVWVVILARIELGVAIAIVGYVCLRYLLFFCQPRTV